MDQDIKETQIAQWDEERAYFDAIAERAGGFDLERIAARYEAAMNRPLFPLEVGYALMGNLRGKRVLDVGCGNGENSLLFARWGADVTGVDISAGAIALAKTRAAQFGLSANTRFLVMPFEEVAQAEAQFDVVWSAAFLHHVLNSLDAVVSLLHDNVKSDGLVVLIEPVRLSAVLKRIRSFVPPFPEGTPDERPLEASDLAKIWRRFEVNERRLFGPVSRACDQYGSRIFPQSYETGGKLQRGVFNAMYEVDRILMRLPVFESAAMIMVASLSPLAQLSPLSTATA